MIRLLVVVLFSQICHAKNGEIPAFSILSSSYSSVVADIHVDNIPTCKSEGPFPACNGWSALYLFEQFSCKELNQNCSTLDPAKVPSPLFLSTFSNRNIPEEKRGAFGEYDSIPFLDKEIGGSVRQVLANFKATRLAYSDSCYPVDQFVAKYHGDVSLMQKAFLDLKQKYYDKKSEGDLCIDCMLQDLEQNFDLKRDNVVALKALSEATFDKFLFDLFLKTCKQAVPLKPPYEINSWPEINSQVPTYDQAISKMKDILKQGRIFSTGACLNEKRAPDTSCKAPHDFTISGYRKICKPDKSCREVLKILNSWGEDWQKENSDGWVDASTLYEYMKFNPQMITYLTPAG